MFYGICVNSQNSSACESESDQYLKEVSYKRVPEEEGNIRKCLHKYLVICVRRHLQAGAAFPSTRSSTVGSRSTVAQSVTSHLFRMSI